MFVFLMIDPSIAIGSCHKPDGGKIDKPHLSDGAGGTGLEWVATAISFHRLASPQTPWKHECTSVQMHPVHASQRLSVKKRLRQTGVTYQTTAMDVAVDRTRTPSESLLFPDKKDKTMRMKEI